MDLMTQLDKHDVREFFSKNWMTHDAMWYGACVRELGPAKANQLNKAAVRLMAGIEIKRVVKLMGGRPDAPLTDFHELAEIIETTFGLVKAGFMNFDFASRKRTCCKAVFMSASPIPASAGTG